MIIGYFAQSYGCNIREQLLQELPELALRMMKLAKANSRRFVNAQLRKAKNQQILVNAENSLTEKQQVLEQLNKDIADLQAEIEAFNQQKVIASKNLQTNTKQPFISDTKQNHEQINVENQSSVIIHLTGKEFGEFEETPEGLKQLREIAINYLIKLMKDGESVYCKAVNSDVSFDTTGIKKIKSFSSNRIKLKSLFAIKKLIKNATLVTADKISYDVEERKRGVTYDVIKSPIIVDGIEYGVRMVLRKLPTGKYQYDVQIRDNINVIFDSFVQAIKNDEGRSADKSDVLHRCNYNYTKKIIIIKHYLISLLIKQQQIMC